MRLSIDDEVTDQLNAQRRPGKSLPEEATDRLRETLHVGKGTRVVLGVQELDRLEQAFGTGLPIRDFSTLLHAAESLGQLRLGDVRLQFTPPQLRSIQERAAKIGYTTEEFVARVAARLLVDVFMVPPAEVGVFAAPEPAPEPESEPEPAEQAS